MAPRMRCMLAILAICLPLVSSCGPRAVTSGVQSRTGGAEGARSSTTPSRAPSILLTDAVTRATAFLADFRGHPTVLVIFATWCTYCRDEVPELNHLQTELRGRAAVVAIDGDPTESEETVRRFSEAYQVGYPLFLDAGATAKALRVIVIPTQVVLDANGDVQLVHQGPIQIDRLRDFVETKLLR